MEERRESCNSHRKQTEYLEQVVWKGNGSKSLKDRVVKLEILLWVIMGLLVGNGGLLAMTMSTVSKLVEGK